MSLLVKCKVCDKIIHRINKQYCCGVDYYPYHLPYTLEGLELVGNILTRPINPEPTPELIPDDDVLPEPPKPKKIPKPKNQFNYQFKKVRPFVLERDNYTCQKCGSTKYLEVNHIVPRSKGGTNDMDNLETLCDLCHAEEHKGESVYNIMIKACRDRRN